MQPPGFIRQVIERLHLRPRLPAALKDKVQVYNIRRQDYSGCRLMFS